MCLLATAACAETKTGETSTWKSEKAGPGGEWVENLHEKDHLAE